MIGLYAIVRPDTRQAYFGSTSDIKRRFKDHRVRLNGGRHHATHLQRAWDKYGADAFVFKVLTPTGTLEEARELEQAFLDCFYGDMLYNCKNTATGFPIGDAHFSRRDDWHMKTVMQRLTPEERRARYGKALGTTRNPEPYILAAAKRVADPGFSARLSAACKGKREVVECPHCGLKGGGGNMRRYHFEKCKDKP
jgi:group I intron endonuclease